MFSVPRPACAWSYINHKGTSTSRIDHVMHTHLLRVSDVRYHYELGERAGSRLWRPGFLACLIEKALPTWVITPIGFARGSVPSRIVLVSRGLSGRPAVADIVVVMAGLFGGSDRLRELAIAKGLLHKKGRTWWAQPLVDLPDTGRRTRMPLTSTRWSRPTNCSMRQPAWSPTGAA